jgi:endo-1,4-beta-xylanase
MPKSSRVAQQGVVPAPGARFLGNTWPGGWSVTLRDADLDPLFNQVTPECWGQWGLLEPQNNAWRWEVLDAMYEHCRSDGLRCGQTAFFWGEVKDGAATAEPAWVFEPHNDLPAATLHAEAREYLSEYMRRYGRYMDHAIVVNEFMHAPTTFRGKIGGLRNLYGTGWDWIVWAFEETRKAAKDHGSNVKLILNEYGVLGPDWQYGPGGTIDGMIEVANVLKARGLIDGVGCQSHFLEKTSASAVRARLDRLASEVSLPIYITEFDLNIADDAEQKAKMEELFPVFWTHPAVCGVTLWALREARTTWKPHTYLIRADRTDRPAMAWLREYVAKNPARPCVVNPR